MNEREGRQDAHAFPNAWVSAEAGQLHDFLEFPTPEVSNAAYQLRLDAWLLPFLNVYAIGGRVTGNVRVPLAIEGSALLGYLGRGDLCTGGPLEPALCSRSLDSVVKPEYDGWNFGLGGVLAGGWDRYFATLPVSFVWTKVSILEQTVTALNISPRIGARIGLGKLGVLAAYTGATYLKADIDVRGSATLDTSNSGVPGLGDQTVVEYTIFQGNQDRWNAVLGLNWEIKKMLNLHLEGGFLGSRSNIIASATFRW